MSPSAQPCRITGPPKIARSSAMTRRPRYGSGPLTLLAPTTTPSRQAPPQNSQGRRWTGTKTPRETRPSEKNRAAPNATRGQSAAARSPQRRPCPTSSDRARCKNMQRPPATTHTSQQPAHPHARPVETRTQRQQTAVPCRQENHGLSCHRELGCPTTARAGAAGHRQQHGQARVLGIARHPPPTTPITNRHRETAAAKKYHEITSDPTGDRNR